MKIVGHRGAASLALENTLESIQAARAAGVDMIEFDVRLTADHHFVLSHDATFQRVGSHDDPISKLTLEELSAVTLHNGETVPTLQMALEAAGPTPVLIEVKNDDWAQPLADLIGTLQPDNINVIAMDANELNTFHQLLPTIPTYLVQQFNPIDILYALRTAHRCGFRGIDFNFWLLSPFSYWLARHYGLEIIVYTVNHAWIARFLAALFPDITISTDRPQELQFLRSEGLEA
jgi:glycerophosphoryl diester phosphodiesterase